MLILKADGGVRLAGNEHFYQYFKELRDAYPPQSIVLRAFYPGNTQVLNSFDTPAIFLADCHLPLIQLPGQEGWTPRVLTFLRNEALDAKSIFLVGDLFDFWFEWRHSVPSAAFPVLAELSNLVRGGRRVVYLGGNHDGHVGKFLTDEVGIEISREAMDVEISGKRFHIIHGDGIAPADHGYRMLRRMVRWPPTEAIYRMVHPDLGIWLAHKLSGVSREQFSSKVVWAPDSYRDYARRKIEEGFDCVVMGHRHEAERIEYGKGVFLAVGDWIRSGSYGYVGESGIELKYFRLT